MSNVDVKTTPMAFARQMQEFKKFKDAFPRFVGNMAINFFKDSFRRQGFIDRRGVDNGQTVNRDGERRTAGAGQYWLSLADFADQYV